MGLKKLFREGLRDLLYWVNYGGDAEKDSTTASHGSIAIGMKSVKGSSSINSDREINITVTSAVGGKIVKVYWYDEKLSREYVNLHIITDQEDLANELAQIITRESLQR